MEVERMNAEQVAAALERVQGGWDMIDYLGVDSGRERLLEREAALLARQAVVGKPLRGVCMDSGFASDNDNLRQGIQHALAALDEGQVDSSRLHEALRRSDEMRAKWSPREVEAVQLAKDLEAARFAATVAHEALRRIVAAKLVIDYSTAKEGFIELGSAIDAAREIVGGAS